MDNKDELLAAVREVGQCMARVAQAAESLATAVLENAEGASPQGDTQGAAPAPEQRGPWTP